jgi:hypothetical protein
MMDSMKIGNGKDQGSTDQIDEFDLTAAIWILSSLDENPIMTYRGVVDRVGSTEESVRRLVFRRRELFRTGAPETRLDRWKSDMKEGIRIPNWIRDQREPSRAISDLTSNDVFRNQFRVEDKAKKSDLEIIEWGLQHVERLRKADTEHRQESKARWSLILSSVSVLIALGTSLATTIFQAKSISAQMDMKIYETEFKPKQEGYHAFVAALANAGILALKHDRKAFEKTDEVQARFYALEPFLGRQTRQEIFEKMQGFISFCTTQIESPQVTDADKDAAVIKYTNQKNDLRDKLYEALFHNVPFAIR